MDRKYLFTSFEGRINRGKFWLGLAILIAIGIVAMLIDMLLGTSMGGGRGNYGVVSLVVSLASIYFALALYAKRWHDRDKSGWWSLILLIPLIGFVWWIVECGILEGTRGPNRYGPDPLA